MKIKIQKKLGREELETADTDNFFSSNFNFRSSKRSRFINSRGSDPQIKPDQIHGGNLPIISKPTNTPMKVDLPGGPINTFDSGDKYTKREYPFFTNAKDTTKMSLPTLKLRR